MDLVNKGRGKEMRGVCEYAQEGALNRGWLNMEPRKRPGYRHLLGLAVAVAAALALTRLLLPSFLLPDGHGLQMRMHLHLRLDQCFCLESYI
jgi:hypothetical protein